MRAFDSPRGLQPTFQPREMVSGRFPKTTEPGSTPGRGSIRVAVVQQQGCLRAMQATGVRVPSAAPSRRMDGREAYGSGSLNRRGRQVLRWFESSSIPHQCISPGRQSRVIGRAPGASREVACSSHAFVAQSFPSATTRPGSRRLSRGGVMANAAGSDPVALTGRGSSTLPLGTRPIKAFGPESLGYRAKWGGGRTSGPRVRLPASDAPLRGRNTSERSTSINAEPEVEGYRLSSGLSRVRVPPDLLDP